jgi:hypothetical protein
MSFAKADFEVRARIHSPTWQRTWRRQIEADLDKKVMGGHSRNSKRRLLHWDAIALSAPVHLYRRARVQQRLGDGRDVATVGR